MLISVITPTFNSANHIKKNIDSLNDQIKDFEQIFIDNFSSDLTLDIIKKIAEYPYSIIREKDNGIYDAMKKGINIANGNYILFLNSDDWLPKNTFEIIKKEIENNPNVDIFYGNTIHYKCNDIKFFQKSDINKIFKTNSLSHQAMYYSKKIFEEYKFDNKYSVAADYDLNIKLSKDYYKFFYIDKVLSNNLMGGYSSNLLNSFKDFFQIQKKHNGILKAIIFTFIEYKFQIFKLIFKKIYEKKN